MITPRALVSSLGPSVRRPAAEARHGRRGCVGRQVAPDRVRADGRRHAHATSRRACEAPWGAHRTWEREVPR